MNHPTGSPRRPVLLIILDGFGVNPSKLNNGIAMANTPRLDHYFAHHPHTTLHASGRAVGLPDGQMGNSEVGHITLGSGCIVRQDIVHIDDSIHDGAFFHNDVLRDAADTAVKNQSTVHLLGLVSDGGVHSHVRHLLALIELCQRRGATPILHMITDGRDTSPRSARQYLKTVEAALAKAGGYIATVMGRYYAMDRDNRWERTELAWRAMIQGEGMTANSAQEAIEQAYQRNENDEFIKPTLIRAATLTNNNPLIFFNFRKDRTRQLTSALFKEHFSEFDRGENYAPIRVTCFTAYDDWYGLPYAFEQEHPKTSLAEIISKAGLKQFHCAETEKYPHVTYFFNAGHGEAFAGEERTIIPSPKVATYDLAPEMSAKEVSDTVIAAIDSAQYAFIVVNYANGDMVGHSAIPAAIIKAVETVDREVGRVLDRAQDRGYSVVLTADHGNCDEMVDPATGEPSTQHSVFPVPCLIMDEIPWQLSTGGGLYNIAATVLHLMGLNIPDSIEGTSLLIKPLKNNMK